MEITSKSTKMWNEKWSENEQRFTALFRRQLTAMRAVVDEYNMRKPLQKAQTKNTNLSKCCYWNQIANINIYAKPFQQFSKYLYMFCGDTTTSTTYMKLKIHFNYVINRHFSRALRFFLHLHGLSWKLCLSDDEIVLLTI